MSAVIVEPNPVQFEHTGFAKRGAVRSCDLWRHRRSHAAQAHAGVVPVVGSGLP